MRYTIFIFFCFVFIKTNAQIISLSGKLMQGVNDTSISLQYFKNVDSILLNKIDSFDLFLKNDKYELDSNFFYVIDMGGIFYYGCNKKIVIHYASQYCDYISVANLGAFKRPSGNRTPFAFFFYKSKLVICRMAFRKDLHLTDESIKLLTNLIYESVNESEKKLILGYPQYEYNVLVKPLEEYCIE